MANAIIHTCHCERFYYEENVIIMPILLNLYGFSYWYKRGKLTSFAHSLIFYYNKFMRP